MNLSEFSIERIASFITGDIPGWPRRTGSQLVKFFNNLGFRDVYGAGFPSRFIFSREKIDALNGTPKLKDVFREMLDPRLWQNSDRVEHDLKDCVDQVNEILKYDGYEIIKDGNFYKVRALAGTIVEIENRFENTEALSELLIEEQIKKCREKIESDDYSGAITNARTLVEAVCVNIEKQLDPNPQGNDGNLTNLFNRTRKLLNLDPSQDISDALRQVIVGLSNIINGLSSMRNKMSDAHGVSYKPNRHHAKLAVNSAKTLVDFLFDTMNYQIEKGYIKKIESSIV